MEYEIVELEEKIVEGISVRTTNQDRKSIQDRKKVYMRF